MLVSGNTEILSYHEAAAATAEFEKETAPWET